MRFDRTSGILLHPTSLPGSHGIGDLGPAAYRWVEWLSGAGCKLWQVLPLAPTGYGDSPYQCFSAFAGNPYLISPELLLRDGLLHSDDLVEMVDWPADKVDFGRLIPWKLNLLERAFIQFGSAPAALRREFERFCHENAVWLDDYALFMALKESHGGGAWYGWPAELRKRDPRTLEKARQTLREALDRFSFYQFVFYRQWTDLRQFANGRAVRILGDIPIFVASDSADVWAHPELFYLDAERRPTVVAGVPPDYFSPTGQLWGNPLYRWEAHKAEQYQWWLARLGAVLKTVDIIRLDHFRGFAGYWEVPAGEKTAVQGRWVPGPGAGFFEAVQKAFGALPILAEDLGEITPDVIELRQRFDLPGMKILQFAFSGPDNPFLPHNYTPNFAAYTGTHDNDTALGWYASAPEQERDFARRYLRVDGSDFAWDLIRAVWRSVAVFALAPMQDFLGLGTAARMNYPSRLGGNWEWRMSGAELTPQLQQAVRDLNTLYLR
ncbi:MAG: 4-alpha-glucanotransferase [Anaerolineales bacterium]|nr:4-alpha-glucanotransferase [Anaerolineales bacterium]